MSMMCCKGCGTAIDTDYHPEAFYLEMADGREIELDFVLCDWCKDDKGRQFENYRKDVSIVKNNQRVKAGAQ